MADMIQMQKAEANNAFAKFVRKHYEDWILNPETRPLMSPDLFKKRVFPLLDGDEKVYFILIDNFRLDQWRVVKDLLAEDFTFDESLEGSVGGGFHLRREPLLQHPADGDAIRPQRYLLWPDAGADREDVSRLVGR